MLRSNFVSVSSFFLYIFSKTIFPFEGVSFFERHLRLLRQTRSAIKNKRLFNLFLFITTLKSVHFFYFFITSLPLSSSSSFLISPISTFSRVVHYDCVTLAFGRSALNINGCAVIASGVYMYAYFFRQAPQLNNNLLKEIVIHKNDGFFISPKKGSKTVVDYIKFRLVIVFNCVESASISSNLLAIGIHLLLGSMLVKGLSGLPVVQQFLYHLIFTFTGAFFLFSILTHLYILSLIISLGASQLLVLSLKLVQLSDYCKNAILYSKKCSSKNVDHFFNFNFYHQHLVSIFPYFQEYNVVYGRLFVVFFGVNAVNKLKKIKFFNNCFLAHKRVHP